MIVDDATSESEALHAFDDDKRFSNSDLYKMRLIEAFASKELLLLFHDRHKDVKARILALEK